MPPRFSQEGIFFLLLLSQFQYSSHALVDTLLGDGALVDGIHHGIVGPNTMSTPALMLLTAASALEYCWVMAPISMPSVMMMFW